MAGTAGCARRRDEPPRAGRDHTPQVTVRSSDVSTYCDTQVAIAMVEIMPIFRSSGRRVAAVLGIACLGLTAAACSSSSSSSSSAPASSAPASSPAASPSTSAPVSGTANVAYASSLQYLNTNVVQPAFTAATGAAFSGTGTASGTPESDIASGEISPNVFESVGGDNITPLEPKFTSWYIPYA